MSEPRSGWHGCQVQKRYGKGEGHSLLATPLVGVAENPNFNPVPARRRIISCFRAKNETRLEPLQTEANICSIVLKSFCASTGFVR